MQQLGLKPDCLILVLIYFLGMHNSNCQSQSLENKDSPVSFLGVFVGVSACVSVCAHAGPPQLQNCQTTVLCVFACLHAPTTALPSTGPEHLHQLPALKNLEFTGVLALISQYCNYLFTHLPLRQTVNSPHPPQGRHCAVLGSHLTYRYTVGAQEMCTEGMRMEDVKLSHLKFICSCHSFIKSFNLEASIC